jgi:hypothetical protein
MWRPPDYGKRPLFHPEDEGSTSLRNAGNFTSRRRVASQNIWIYSSTSVITSDLTLYWQCFFQWQQQEGMGATENYCWQSTWNMPQLPNWQFFPYVSKSLYNIWKWYSIITKVSFIFQKLSSKASPWTARWLCSRSVREGSSTLMRSDLF